MKNLLESRNYTQQEIAKMLGCSDRTVQRYAKKSGLGIGQGRRHYWQFSENSVYLSYLLGIILTDGTVTKNKNQVSIYSTTPEIINHSDLCFDKINLKSTTKEIKHDEGHLGKKQSYRVSCYSSMFATWLSNVTSCKDIIPDFLFTSNPDCQLAFLAGIIDGDGRVDNSGSILVRATSEWLKQIPDILQPLGIRTGGYKTVSILDSGKTYRRVSIRRSDYRSIGGTCYHPIKKYRILHAKENRKRTPKRIKYPCPTCNGLMTNKNAISCRACYLKSERFHNHLKSIAKKGNIAANKSRWDNT